MITLNLLPLLVMMSFKSPRSLCTNLKSSISLVTDLQGFLVILVLAQISRKKLANALFGQKNQHPALFPKLIRKMPLFCNSKIRRSRFMKTQLYYSRVIFGLMSRWRSRRGLFQLKNGR